MIRLMKIENVILNDNIQKALQEMGFEESTQIQQEAIPVILEGNDIIGQSNTGTGKTAAYGITILEKINEQSQRRSPNYSWHSR